MSRRLALATAATLALSGAAGAQPPAAARPAAPPAVAPGRLPVFVDVLPQSGITWTRSFGDHEMSNIVEGTGSGACVFDFDGDGLLDVYFPQGRWETTVSDNRVYAQTNAGIVAQYSSNLLRNQVYSNSIGVQLNAYAGDVFNNLIYANTNQAVLVQGSTNTVDTSKP